MPKGSMVDVAANVGKPVVLFCLDLFFGQAKGSATLVEMCHSHPDPRQRYPPCRTQA